MCPAGLLLPSKPSRAHPHPPNIPKSNLPSIPRPPSSWIRLDRKDGWRKKEEGREKGRVNEECVTGWGGLAEPLLPP